MTMRRSREETVAFYRDEMLKGKSEDFIKQFDGKDVNKQYVAIANWKRSLKKQEANNTGTPQYSLSNLLKFIKDANKEVENLDTLSPKEAEKVLDAVNQLLSTIKNFDRIKKQRLLAELLKEEEKINKEGNSLRKRIANIQKELE